MDIFDNFFDETKKTNSNEKKSVLEHLMVDWFSEAKLSYKDYKETFFPPVFEIFKSNEYVADLIKESEKEIHNLELNIAFIYLIYNFPHKHFIKELTSVFYDFYNDDTPREYFNFGFSNKECKNYPEFEHIETTTGLIFSSYRSVKNNQNPFDDFYKFKELKFSFPEGFIKLMEFLKNIKTENKLYSLLELYCYKQQNYETSKCSLPTPEVQNCLRQILSIEIAVLNKNSVIQIDLDLFQEFWDLYTYKIGYEGNSSSNLEINEFTDFKNFIEKNDINTIVKYLLFSLKLKGGSYQDEFLHKTLIYLESKLDPNENILLDFLNIYPTYQETIIDNLYLKLANKIKINYNSETRKKLEEVILDQNTKAKYLKFFIGIADSIPNNREKEIVKAKYNEKTVTINVSSGWNTFSEGDKLKSIKNTFKEITKIINLSVINIRFDHYEGICEPILEINLNGIKQKISYEEVNSILFNENIGYQLIPIPIKLMPEEYYGENTYLCGLSFLNEDQYDFLLTKHVPQNFADLDIETVYSNYNFSNNNSLTFSEFVKEKSKNVSSNKFLADNNWKWFKDKYVDELPSAKKWYNLMEIIIGFSGSKKPTKKWLAEMSKAIKDHGEILFYKELRTLIDNSIKESFWYFDSNRNALKGIAWACILTEDSTSLAILKQIISSCYTKIPGVGPKSGATGNSALEALISHPNPDSFGILNLLRNQTKYNRFANVLDKFIDKFISTSDEDEQTLADKAIPNFGFKNGEKTVNYPGFSVKYIIKNKKLSKKWIVNSKESTITPLFIKEKKPKLIKEVSSEFKTLNTFFKLTKSRIKTFWLFDRKWKYNEWEENINKKEMLSPWLSGLIWKNETQNSNFILYNKQLLNIENQEITIAENDTISLWHPVLSNSDEIVEWQKFIIKNKIEQTERQVFREFYPFSETEIKLNSTQRFNHHFLTVNKLMAIANSAGWIFTYVHEDVNWPRIFIKALNITAHLECEYDRNDFAIPTKNFYFTKNDTREITYNQDFEKLSFDKISKITLSEICRDIDLFIATTSVAHNIELSEKTEIMKQYREDFSVGKFSENAQAKIRNQIIELIGTKVGLKNFSFEKNYLLINGNINKYSINLGSGFAQIKETKRHIPLIPDTKTIKKKINNSISIMDDETLFIILAKALFLQNDTEITDEKIMNIIKT